MNKIVLQLWEESNNDGVYLNDGCTLHLDLTERNRYVDEIYSNRTTDFIPDSYDRIVGDAVTVFIQDDMYQKLTIDKTIKLTQHEFQNMINFEEIIFNEAEI